MEKEKKQEIKKIMDNSVDSFETNLMIVSFAMGMDEETANFFVERMEKLINKVNRMIEMTKELGKIASEMNKDEQEDEMKENQTIIRN